MQSIGGRRTRRASRAMAPFSSVEMLEPSRSASTALRVGTDSTVMPRAAEASAAEPRRAESASITTVELVEEGTAMVAVTSTLPATTEMLTAEGRVPAMSAIFLVTEALISLVQSLTLPLAVNSSTTLSTEGIGST
eukprot:scaffold47711_cov55-Phaeocystis_antarctica.AAC.1